MAFQTTKEATAARREIRISAERGPSVPGLKIRSDAQQAEPKNQCDLSNLITKKRYDTHVSLMIGPGNLFLNGM